MGIRVSDYQIIIREDGVSRNRVRQTSQSLPKERYKKSIGRSAIFGRLMKDTTSMLASRVGDYTGNRTMQRRINRVSRLASVGLTAYINPIAGGIALASYMAEDGIDLHIRNMRRGIQADYSRRVSGNTETSGSRYSGRRR
jgi:hypothetical protein